MNLFIKFSSWYVEFFSENSKEYLLKGEVINGNKNYDYTLSDHSCDKVSILKLRRKWFGYSKEYDGLFCPKGSNSEIPFYLFHKPYWKPYTKLCILDDEYVVIQHKFWYSSIFKNNHQIGLIKEKVFYFGSQNSVKIQLDDNVDLNLICTLLFSVYINKADYDGGAEFTVDLTSIVLELRKRDESWQPNLKL